MGSPCVKIHSKLYKELAKTGDSERVQLLVEWTLEMRNEKAHGILLDINQ